MRRLASWIAPWMGLVIGLSGCHSPSVTAVSLNSHYCDHKWAFLYDPCKEPEGIPFYLPKPLLIIAKNFRNIEETKVGLTDSAPIPNFFDDQAKYADLNARTNFAGLDGNAATGTGGAQTSGDEKFPTTDAKNLASVASARVYSETGAPISPGVVASDGMKPNAFYTYHIVFIPDLTQKYGLKIKGGAGEIRAAMNLVNGWQFTGLGPYYMKDSSTAQNTLSAGITANLAASGVADVVKAVAQLKPGTTGAGGLTGAQAPGGTTPAPAFESVEKVKALADAMRQLNPRFLTIPAYAEISVYEPFISPEGTMEWKLIAEKSYNRDVVATDPVSAQAVMNLLKTTSNSTMPLPPLANRSATRAVQPAAFEPSLTSPNEIAQLPLLQPLSPKPSAPTSSSAPASIKAPSLPQGPTASSMPSVQMPHTMLTPGTAMRRNSIRSEEQGDPKADEALIQTQAPAMLPVANGALAQAGNQNGSSLAQTAPPSDGVTTVDRQLGLTQKILSQAMALRASTAPATLANSAAPVVVPVPPSSGNQVNLNQYFGKTKLAAAPADVAPAKRFSLFHRHEKQRPKISTINLAGVDTQAAAAPALASPPPSNPAQAPTDRPPGAASPRP